MKTKSLLLTLSNSNAITDPYWLNMEIKKDEIEDGMTVAEAADLIDSAYNIKTCEAQNSDDIWSQGAGNDNYDIWSGISDKTGIDEETLAAQKRFADNLKTNGYTEDCDSTGSIAELLAYSVTIKIFRSHADELYKLQMANGTAGLARKFEGRVVHTVDVENATSHTFDNPIIAKPVIVWQGSDGGKLTILGNTVYWETPFTGTLRAEFDTEWDEVTIRVTGEHSDSEMITGTDPSDEYNEGLGTGWYSGAETGEEIDDYQNIQCSVLGFYHYQYEELLLSRPEEDESTSETDRINICNFVMTAGSDDTGVTPYPPGERPDCQQHVNESIICQCGGKEKSDNHYEVVPCPDGVPAGTTLSGGTERTVYKDCGYRDEANDPDVYEEKCCGEWSFDHAMPLCKKVVKPFTGVDSKEIDKSKYPEGTEFVIVSPADGNCGEWTTEQVLNGKNCCDVIPPLVWDDESSAGQISPGSSGLIVFSGGDAICKIKVRGNGFWLDAAHTIRDGFVMEKYAYIYLDDDACGVATVTVSDKCTSVSGKISSTYGVWEEIEYDESIAQQFSGETPDSWLSSRNCGGAWCALGTKVLAGYKLVEGSWNYRGDSVRMHGDIAVFKGTYPIGHIAGCGMLFDDWCPIPSGRGVNGAVGVCTDQLGDGSIESGIARMDVCIQSDYFAPNINSKLVSYPIMEDYYGSEKTLETIATYYGVSLNVGCNVSGCEAGGAVSGMTWKRSGGVCIDDGNHDNKLYKFICPEGS